MARIFSTSPETLPLIPAYPFRLCLCFVTRVHHYREIALMHHTIPIDCPSEILMGLHLYEEQFADFVKEEAAFALFREGRLSSGMAARWLGMPREHFLLKAMRSGGATLLQNNEDDWRRETALL